MNMDGEFKLEDGEVSGDGTVEIEQYGGGPKKEEKKRNRDKESDYDNPMSYVNEG